MTRMTNEWPYVAGFLAAAAGGGSCGGVILKGLLPYIRQWLVAYGERTAEQRKANELLLEVRDAVHGLAARMQDLEQTVELAIAHANVIPFNGIKQ